MSNQRFVESLINSQVDGAALTNTTTATSLLVGASKYTLYGGFFDVIGKKIKVKAAGRISTVVTTPGSLTLDIRLGAVIAANGGAMSLNVVAKTNVPWFLEWELTCRAIGSGTGANLMHQGFWISEAVIGAAVPTVGGAGTHMLPNAAPAVGTGFDSTASQVVDLFGTWSVANASNSILVHQFELISLN